MSVLDVGTRVRIKKGSRYYNLQSTANPTCEGVITENNRETINGFIYSVAWDNGSSNQYQIHDLEEVIPTPKFKAGDKVKVVSSLHCGLWYADEIGEIYTIKGVFDGRTYQDKTAYDFEECTWKVLYEDDLELITKQVVFNPTEIDAAAEFLESNDFLDMTSEDYKEMIYNTIKQHALTEVHSVGTFGFQVQFTRTICKDVVFVDVLVRPSYGDVGTSISTVMKDGKLVAEF